MITLKKPLNYEARSSYNMLIKAEDQGIPTLSSTANVLITINDIQDQKPFFLNGPYSISIPENILPVSNFYHSSEIQGLCLMKLPSETLQNLPYFWNMKPHMVLFFIPPIYDDIYQGIH